MLLAAGPGRICFDLVGPDAAPVVCLAHALSSDMGVWAEQVPPLLQAGWRVLRIDMRGHGGSDAVPGACTMAGLAGDVVTVLDFLGLPQVHFVGLSIGGMIGQQLALDHAPRLRSLLLSGTSPNGVPGGLPMWQQRFDAMDRAGSVEALADATMDRWFTDAFRARRPNRWLQIRSTVAQTSLEGYRCGGLAIANFDVSAQLPGISLPTLVVCGDGDPGTPPAGNRLIAALVPGARYREIANARHIPMVEHPDLYSGILLDWLTSCRGG